MKSKYLVSVIIPTYNRASFIERCIKSLVEQTYRPLEVLIVDDGSQDNTFKIIQKLVGDFESKDFKILYFYQENMGAPYARNKGIQESSGDWIQFIDSDDYVEGDQITKQVNELKKRNGDLSICDYKIVNKVNSSETLVKNNGNLLLKIANGHSIFTGSALIGRSIIKKGILWNENLYREQDKEFLFKVLFLSKRFIYNPNTYAIYIKHAQTQITDIYSETKPQAIEIIKSNLKFTYRYKEFLDIKKFILIFNHLFHISFRFLIIYKLKTFIKNISK